MNEQKFMSPVRFNREYNVPLTRLRGWIKQGRVSGFRSGNRFYISVPALLAQIEAGDFKEERG